jgi:hypothetical protein
MVIKIKEIFRMNKKKCIMLKKIRREQILQIINIFTALLI